MSSVGPPPSDVFSFLPDHVVLLIYGLLPKEAICALALACKNLLRCFKLGDSQLHKRVFLDTRGIRSGYVLPDRAALAHVDHATTWRKLLEDTNTHETMKWKLNQVFGEDPSSVNEENVITAVEFSSCGEFLSIGYQCGQIVVFRNSSGDTFRFHSQFESHQPEFDFLTSLEIEEKIHKIRWVKHGFPNNSRWILSTNDKTVKLWRLYEKTQKKMSLSLDGLSKGEGMEEAPTATTDQQCKNVFENAHAYNINSISLCSDGELFISSDDLRINLWTLGNRKEAFTVVDIKPSNMNELSEVLTSSSFHPTESHTFTYSTSKGVMYTADMRQKALCDRAAMKYYEQEKHKSFFSEVTSSIGDFKYSHDGMHLIARDYMNLKVWDVRYNNAPVVTFDVHSHLRSKLYELYENDTIFDKFSTAFSGNDLHAVTGSYSNNFMVYDIATAQVKYLQAVNPRDRRRKNTGTLPTTQDIQFNEKVSHVAWHPNNNLIATAAGNYIYLYHLVE